MPKEEGSLNGCELAQAVGAAARHRIKKAHASSQSAGLPEATGAQRAWEETCFSGAAAISGSCGFFILFYFILQPISQFPEEETLSQRLA